MAYRPRWTFALVILALATMDLGMPDRLRADGGSDFSADDLDFFEQRIRPVLIEKCLGCHGEHKQNSGLRLDSREALLRGGSIEGPSILEDEPESSPLLRAVKHEIDNLKMPPEGGKLPDVAIADLERWIQRGAPWPRELRLATPGEDPSKNHWAFQPVIRPHPPAVSQPNWLASSVDAFVLARLDAAGLKPSPPADRRTLIRRASFDLLGLPPTSEEVEAFLSDPSPDEAAFASLVDRLLSSPLYGERWGRHWLDIARYSDTKGYVFQEERRYPHAYTYRDYVIRAFNEDKSYDQFITEQLAADKLANQVDPAPLAAMGFLTVGRRFLNNQHDIIDDRIDVVSRGILGLTVGCARCHDHKYDPIPSADYYSLYGVFASSREPDSLPQIGLGQPGPEVDDYIHQKTERQKKVESFASRKREEIRKDFRERATAYLLASHELEYEPTSGKLDDVARSRQLEPVRLRFFIERLAEALKRANKSPDPVLAAWVRLAPCSNDNLQREASELERLVGVSSPQSLNPLVATAILEDPEPTTFPEVIERYGRLISSLSRGASDLPGLDDLISWVNAVESPFEIPADTPLARLINRAERNELRELEKSVAALDVTHPGSPPRAMVLVDNPEPFEPYIFVRGNPGNRGERVPRRFLKVIAGENRPAFSQGSGRFELAQAIVDPTNPLTARVFVNRLWMHHFVQPLVGTPSDFGIRSEPPTHPELLDWLASEFVSHGWSIKHLHRVIMNSNTYRQQSLKRPEAEVVDPENRLLWRQNRRRIEFEAMRDSLLAASGRLDLRMTGRPGLDASNPEGRRRTIYSQIDRQNLEGIYRTFDFAGPDTSSPGRPRTTVPQQALFLMNSAFVAEQARSLARRVENAPDIPGMVDSLYQIVFQRDPTPWERSLGVSYLSRSSEHTNVEGELFVYGHGKVDPVTGEISDFSKLPYWSGEAWQFSPDYPDREKGHARLSPTRGHAPKEPGQAVILRWTAPFQGVYSARVTLRHRNQEGDGVRVRLITKGKGILTEGIAHNNRSNVIIDRIELAAGETLDFCLDPRENDNSDSFDWSPVITRLDADGDSTIGAQTWRASDIPADAAPAPLTSLERYAQVLLMTNEFHFID